MINRSRHYRHFRSNKVIFRTCLCDGLNLLFTQLHFYELILSFKKQAQTSEWCFIATIFPIILVSPINRSLFCGNKKISSLCNFGGCSGLAARGCVGMMLRMQIVSSHTQREHIWQCSLGETHPLNSLSQLGHLQQGIR